MHRVEIAAGQGRLARVAGVQYPIEGIRALTFDCYGTIIDWDGGIEVALAKLPSLTGSDLARLVRDREREEHELLRGPFRLYGEVLGESLRRAAALQGCAPSDDEALAFSRGMGDWPAFADSARALRHLARDYRLALLSNVENDTLVRSAAQVGVSNAVFVTAEDVRSYKPARAHFDQALRRLDLPVESILHVAGSLYHDVRPARELGWSTIWINRRGEPVPDDIETASVYPDLESFARDCR